MLGPSLQTGSSAKPPVLALLGLYALGLAWGVFLQTGPRVGDEAWTWLFSRDLARGLLDVHPALPYLLLHPFSRFGEAGPQATGWAVAALVALAPPLAALAYGNLAGLAVLFSAGFALSAGFARPHSLVLPEVFLLLYALKTGRDKLAAFAGTLLVLTHFQGQVALLAALPLFTPRGRKVLLDWLANNPLVWLEGMRAFALALAVVSGEGAGSPLLDPGGFARGALGGGVAAAGLALLAARGSLRAPGVGLIGAGVALALFLVKRVAPPYGGLVGALAALLAALGLPREGRARSLLALALVLVALPGGIGTGLEVREAREKVRVLAEAEGPLEVRVDTSAPLALRLAGYEGRFYCAPSRLPVR